VRQRRGAVRPGGVAALAGVGAVVTLTDGPVWAVALALAGVAGIALRCERLLRGSLDARLRAELERNEVEELKLAVVESALDAIVTVDDKGLVVDFNPAAENAFGYTRARVLGRAAVDLLVPPRLRAIHREELARLRETDHSPFLGRVVTATAMRADGTEFPVEVAICRIARAHRRLLAIYVRDITERHRAERTRARLASIVESSDDAIIGHDLDGTISSWNEGARRIYGYEAREAIERSIAMLAPPDQGPELAKIADATRRGRSVRRGETVGLTKRGVRVHLSVVTSPTRDERGRVRGAATIARDLTERRAAEATRAELEQQLERSQKMEAVGRLAGGIAHDFNNLLAVIINYTAFLIEEADEGDRRVEDLRRIKGAADSAVSLVHQLLVLGRRDAPQPRAVDGNELVLGTEKLLRRAIGEDITFRTKLAADLWLTHVDPGRCEQVLINLAVNARDAMPNGGQLTIETTNTKVDQYLARRHDLAPGDYVRISVVDSGCGMPKEVVDRIFEPFFTTKGGDRGTGLGLATVYAIVRQAQGAIAVRSEPGAGTSFDVFLPALREAPAVEDTIRIDVRARAGNGETVLLVEDEEAVRELAERILVQNGYRVLAARSGEEALEICRAQDVVEVLVADVIMPGMSGDELAGWMRQMRPNARTVFMSGYNEQSLERHELEEACGPLLRKPFTARSLLFAVQDALVPTSSAPP